jgi:hypothetical protein
LSPTFTCQCLSDTLEGLCDGLSHFSHPSRAAVIYAIGPQDPIRVYDPQNLLLGHELRFQELYLDSEQWRTDAPDVSRFQKHGHINPEKDIGLAGLISFGGRSRSLFYQMWFTEHHPDMCSVVPVQRWLEHAAYRLSHDLGSSPEWYTAISGNFLREYATHAVRDCIVDEMNRVLGWDTHVRVYPILDAILGISRTREEGSWARGELMFVEASAIGRLNLVAEFPEVERPNLANFKHVRKLLLAVEDSKRKLVSDGRSIVGIADGDLPAFSIIADFRGGHGFLKLNGARICSFFDGNFKATTRRAKLVQVEELLLESDLDLEKSGELFRIVSDIVHSAETDKHGATLVIDLNEKPVEISGQRLTEPPDLRNPGSLALARSLAHVDGALHLGADLRLHGFACLLDGRAIAGEDRARGARYNSALRFTAGNPGLLVVVVSSDRPVSIIMEGVELNAQCALETPPTCLATPPTLADWIKAQG